MKQKFLIQVILVLLLQTLLSTNAVWAIAWKLSRSYWSDEDEKVYSNFVEKLCDSKHGNLNRFIRDPQANPLYGEEDKKFYLNADCADLPYLIRAYVAYKLRVPFSYVSSVSGKGGDQRYSKGNRPVEFRDQDYFSSPQQFFSKVILINSGYYRMSADTQNSDHYPVKIQPESIRPGTIYYDPDGHVAIVAKVMSDGRIRVIDGHPDRTISKPWFGAKFTRGSALNGGGFKRWRPLRYTTEGQVRRTSNHNISDYSAVEQYQKSYSWENSKNLSYYDYIRARLAKTGHQLDPLSEFRNMMSDLYEDVVYRSVAVNICIEKGVNRKPHPGSIPWNIYGTDGLWEEFSTPSRDARLKVAFRDFYLRTQNLVLQYYQKSVEQAMLLARAMLEQYEILSPKFTVNYTDSSGKIRILDFDEVSERLFRLSFDPYHSIEYRWGGTEEELALSPDDSVKKRFYELEHRLRNQLERIYNQPTPLSMGPETPPAVSVKKWLTAFLKGQIIYDQPVKIAVSADASYPTGMAPSEIQATKVAMMKLEEKKESLEDESQNAGESTSEKAPVAQVDSENVIPAPTLSDFAFDIFYAVDDLADLLVVPENEATIQNIENN